MRLSDHSAEKKKPIAFPCDGYNFGVPGRVIFIVYVWLLCQPYIQWLGVGTRSDVQLYPLLLALPFLFHSLIVSRGRGDGLLFLLSLACLPIIVIQLSFSSSPLYASIRGTFAYLSVGLLTWALVCLLRAGGPKLSTLALKVVFWSWSALGVVQMVRPHFGTFWREKLIITEGRGSLAFATEPAYFAFAVLLTALAIGMISREFRYVIYASVVAAVVSQSSIGVIYCMAVVIVLSNTRFIKKVVTVGSAAAAWLAAIYLFPTSRIGSVSTAFIADPMSAVRNDMSVGLRYTNIKFPIDGFISSWGFPHGVTAWPSFEYSAFVSSPIHFRWVLYFDPATTGKILSIHGQLLFELGLYGLVYYALFWKLIAKHPQRLRLVVIGVIIFFNGVTLNSPFFSLLLAAVYVSSTGFAEEGLGARDRRKSLRGSRRFGHVRSRPPQYGGGWSGATREDGAQLEGA